MEISFIILFLISLVLFYFGIGENIKIILPFLVWQIIVGTASYLQLFENQPLLFPIVLIGTILIGAFMLQQIPLKSVYLKYLMTIHTLRIGVEWVLFQLYLQQKIPKLMTFEGWNFDVLMGLSALILLSYTLFTSRNLNSKFLILWNIIGLIFLTHIVVLAILSAPLPIQQFAFHQPNRAVLQFPYSWLPSAIVPMVALSHILSIKYLKAQENSEI